MSENRHSTEPATHDPAMDRLVASALSAPEMREEFVAAVAEDLDRVFAERTSAATSGTLARLLENKNSQRHDEAEDANHRRAVAQMRREVRKRAGPATRRFPMGRRMALAASVAAFLITFVWSEPGYSWSQMIQAMRDQAWVQLELVTGQGSQPVGSVSTRRGSPTSEGPTTAASLDVVALGVSRKPAMPNPVVESLLAGRRDAEEIELQLFDLIAGLGASYGKEIPSEQLTIEQARPQVVPEGVELNVTMTRGEKVVRVRFLLDTQTRLPLACEVVEPILASPPDTPLRFSFSYPAQGPTVESAATGAHGGH